MKTKRWTIDSRFGDNILREIAVAGCGDKLTFNRLPLCVFLFVKLFITEQGKQSLEQRQDLHTLQAQVKMCLVQMFLACAGVRVFLYS